MPLLLTICLERKYMQYVDYKILAEKNLFGK